MTSTQTQNHKPHYLIKPSFQGVSKLFMLSFRTKKHFTTQLIFPSKNRNKRHPNDKWYKIAWSAKKSYRKNIPISNGNIKCLRMKLHNRCLWVYVYFKEVHKMLTIDLKKTKDIRCLCKTDKVDQLYWKSSKC